VKLRRVETSVLRLATCGLFNAKPRRRKSAPFRSSMRIRHGKSRSHERPRSYDRRRRHARPRSHERPRSYDRLHRSAKPRPRARLHRSAKPRPRARPRSSARPRPRGNLRQLSRAANRRKLKPGLRLNLRRVPQNVQRSIHSNMSTISHDQKANRFTTEVDGHRAELDYTQADGVMTITHTRVPREIGGRGIAAELMRAALKLAAEHGWSIDPACSYAAAYMRKQAHASDKDHMDELLDEALEESFPASDSPAVGGAN
jgi:predicted GNAT family acetyltransferase